MSIYICPTHLVAIKLMILNPTVSQLESTNKNIWIQPISVSPWSADFCWDFFFELSSKHVRWLQQKWRELPQDQETATLLLGKTWTVSGRCSNFSQGEVGQHWQLDHSQKSFYRIIVVSNCSVWAMKEKRTLIPFHCAACQEICLLRIAANPKKASGGIHYNEEPTIMY